MAAFPDRVVHYRADDACVASYGPYVLFRCFGDVRAEAVNASLTANRAALASRPEGVVSIVLVDPSTKFPSDEMRRASVAVRKLTNRHVAAYVTIIAGDGFWASTVRGALTAINTLAGSAYPSKVFRHVPEGVAWAVAQIGAPSLVISQEIVRELEAMREAGSAG